MPFALVIVGLLLIVTGAKDTYREFGTELVADFTGPGNFTYWLAAMGAVGAVGYYPPLKGFSRLFLGLILLAMFISNRGFFAKLTGALASGPETPVSEPVGKTTPAATSGQNPGGQGTLLPGLPSIEEIMRGAGPGVHVQPPTRPTAPRTIGDAIDLGKFVAGFFL